MSREIALEDRSEAHADQDQDEIERMTNVRRLNKDLLTRHVLDANGYKHYETMDIRSEYALAIKCMTEFVQDISPANLPPQMRNRRLTLLRRLWGE